MKFKKAILAINSNMEGYRWTLDNVINHVDFPGHFPTQITGKIAISDSFKTAPSFNKRKKRKLKKRASSIPEGDLSKEHNIARTKFGRPQRVSMTVDVLGQVYHNHAIMNLGEKGL